MEGRLTSIDLPQAPSPIRLQFFARGEAWRLVESGRKVRFDVQYAGAAGNESCLMFDVTNPNVLDR